MISVEEALEACLNLELPSRIVTLPLAHAHRRRSAYSLTAEYALPLWDQSAMDGFAVSSLETQKTLDVIEIIAAGQWPQREVQAGQCARVMTGAPMPDGADSVIIQENCHYIQTDQKVSLYPNREAKELSSLLKKGANVRLKGEETQKGDIICTLGQELHFGLLGYLASQGWTEVCVFDSLKIALISTGDEIIDPGKTLRKGQIYGTNQVMLQSLIENAGGKVVFKEHALDAPESVRCVFERALETQADLIISTGGVSVGDFDPVKGVLADLGAQLAFWKVKMKPGKPLAVGQIGQTPFFALPGNPVSCIVGFLLFLWPLLQRAHGAPKAVWHLPKRQYDLAHDLQKKHHRAEYMRVQILSDGKVALTGGQSSGWVSSIAKADGLMILPADPINLKSGDTVDVLTFPWGR